MFIASLQAIEAIDTPAIVNRMFFAVNTGSLAFGGALSATIASFKIYANLENGETADES